MTNFTSEQLNKAFDDLSLEKSDAMFSIDIDSKIKELAIKYNLGEEQSKNIDYYVTLSIIGLLKEEQLDETISTELKINLETSTQIASYLKSAVFDIIRNKMTESQERKTILEQNETDVLDPRFESMPDDVKEAISLSNWKEILYQISADNKLNIEQMGLLEDITVKTMKNEIDPDRYESEVTSKMNIDKEKIKSIVKEVSEKIFQEIRKIMKEEQEEDKEETPTENSEEVVPIPPYANMSEGEIFKRESVHPIEETKPIVDRYQEVISKDNEKLNVPSFSIPNMDISKQVTPSAPASSSPAKPHDPYREVI